MSMSEAEVLTETKIMFIAAQETSSTALAWIFYLLCRHPDHLRRARAEFRESV